MTLLQNKIQQINPLETIFTEVIPQSRLNSTTTKSFKKNDKIYQPNETADRIYFVKKGRVKVVSYYDDSKEIIKNLVTVGDIFGMSALLGQERRVDGAVSMEDTELIVVTTETLKSLMNDDPTLSMLIMKKLGDRLMEVENRLEGMVYRNSRSRVIEFLKQLVNKSGQRVGYEMLVRKFFTHQEIASLTATSRQTVTTVLNELRSKNILTFNRRRLLVRDMELLVAEAK
ncbi:MAG: Crp/Fnr family transcriptional regulator [Saprospiraceae bacterium]